MNSGRTNCPSKNLELSQQAVFLDKIFARFCDLFLPTNALEIFAKNPGEVFLVITQKWFFGKNHQTKVACLDFLLLIKPFVLLEGSTGCSKIIGPS